jgi:putative sterol carrier protein
VSIQYRVAFGKKDEAVDGPDDADVVVRIDAKSAELDPTVAYMTGKLKAEGHTGRLLEALWSGDAAAVISRLASRS